MSARIVEEVRRIATTPTLLVALDFDGTVSPLGDDPMAVRAVPEAIRAVDALTRIDDTYVAYVSGRSLRDLAVITERPPVSPVLLAGSHGAEYLLPAVLGLEDEDVEAPSDVDAVTAAAVEAVDGLAGARIEHKRFGFALHTRLADAAATAEANARVGALMRERAAGWRRRAGKDVLEFSWRHEGKDAAIERLRGITEASAVLFAGDDVTDEDAMRSLEPQDLGVRVGDGETAASVRVNDPQELATLLGLIASIRAESS